MTSTNVVAVSPGISGNVGSCSIISTDISVNTFYIQSEAVNSCTGQLVFQSEPYFDGQWIFGGMVGVLLFIFIAILAFCMPESY